MNGYFVLTSSEKDGAALVEKLTLEEMVEQNLCLTCGAEGTKAEAVVHMMGGCFCLKHGMEFSRFMRKHAKAVWREGRRQNRLTGPCSPGHDPSREQRTVVKTERNAPCPCSSGKKFKRCCGSAVREETYEKERA